MSINRISDDDVDNFRTIMKDPGVENLMDLYQRIAGGSAIYPGQSTPLGLAYVALKLNGEAGEFAEHVGKAMRDDGLIPLEHIVAQGDVKPQEVASTKGSLTQNRRASLIKELGDQLWYIQAACRELNITMSQVALINLVKLCDRGNRGQLQGSGDER